MIMKKIICILFFLVFIYYPDISYCFFYSRIVEEDTPFVYKVTLKNFSVSSDKGKTWEVIQKKPIAVDIVKNNAIESVAYKIPPGRYNKVKYMPNATFIMKGYVKYKDLVYYTSVEAENGTAVTENFDLNNPPVDYGEAELTVFGYNEWEYLSFKTENIKFSVKDSKIKEIYIKVDLTNSLALYQTRADPNVYQLMPVSPSIIVFIE